MAFLGDIENPATCLVPNCTKIIKPAYHRFSALTIYYSMSCLINFMRHNPEGEGITPQLSSALPINQQAAEKALTFPGKSPGCRNLGALFLYEGNLMHLANKRIKRLYPVLLMSFLLY